MNQDMIEFSSHGPDPVQNQPKKSERNNNNYRYHHDPKDIMPWVNGLNATADRFNVAEFH